MSQIGKKLMLRFSTLLVLTASFTVIGGTFLVGNNLQRILTLWGESLQMTVYLSDNASPENAAEIETALKGNDNVDQVKFVSRETALGQFRTQMSSYAPDLLNDADLMKFIPSSFQFSVSKKVTANQQLEVMTTISDQLKAKTGVDEVSFGQDWVKNYSQLTNALTSAGLVFAGVIVFSALFVISNCVRSSIYQKKEEIEVLELIGATSTYIRRPFLIEGIAICGVSALLGIGICLGLFEVAQNSLKAELSLLQLASHIQFLPAWALLGFVVSAVVLGFFATTMCLRSLNDGWAASKNSQT